MDPEEEGRVLGAVRKAGRGVDPADVDVDLAYPGRRGKGCIRVAVGRREEVAAGGGKPPKWIPPPVAVLVDPGHGERMQRLDHQGAHAREWKTPIAIDPPDDASRPEEAVVLGVLGHRSHVHPGQRLERA